MVGAFRLTAQGSGGGGGADDDGGGGAGLAGAAEVVVAGWGVLATVESPDPQPASPSATRRTRRDERQPMPHTG